MNDGVNCRYLKESCMLALQYILDINYNISAGHCRRLHVVHCVANILSVRNTVADVLS